MSSTRLLVLGCLRIFQPVHAYVINRELRSWNAEQWAGLNYGSIYHSLRQMTKEGFLEVVEDPDGKRRGTDRTTYRLTQYGEEEFFRLLREQAWSTDAPIDPFSVVLSFADSLPADEMQRVLAWRAQWARSWVENVTRMAEDFEVSPRPADGKPWTVPEQLRLSAGQLRAVAEWAEDMAARYDSGELPPAVDTSPEPTPTPAPARPLRTGRKRSTGRT